MLKSVVSLSARSCQRKRIFVESISYRKPLSTNSAIRRGLKKSNPARGGARSNYRDDGQRDQEPRGNRSREVLKNPRPNRPRERDAELWTNSTSQRGLGRLSSGKEGFNNIRQNNDFRDRGSPINGFRKGPRVAKPNHQHQQDTEDMAESRRLKERKVSPKRRRYLDGGRKPLTLRREEPEHRDHKERERLPTRVFMERIASASRDRTFQVSSEPRRGEDHTEAYESSSPRFSRFDREMPARNVPLTVPYTTPASEFLYGTSVVSAALRFSQRTLYKLYCSSSLDQAGSSQEKGIMQLARSKGIETSRVGEEWSRILDKMSKGRPHNGYILEASPLPKFPVISLKSVDKPQEAFYANLDHQSREEGSINGTDGMTRYSSSGLRYPVVLLLDNIVDPGNLGAILRTAFVFGVDAVAIATRNCAPLSPIVLKASAGASESIRLLSTQHPDNFIEQSQRNGWRLFAAVAPSESSRHGRYGQSYVSTSSLNGPARNHPCILMLGGEGEGLRASLQKRANHVIGIEGQRLGQGGVDSLNVSVAAGVLCEAFMRQPADQWPQAKAKSHALSLDDGSDLGLQRQSISTIEAQDRGETASMLF